MAFFEPNVALHFPGNTLGRADSGVFCAFFAVAVTILLVPVHIWVVVPFVKALENKKKF
jgi:hypothetical protein